MGIWWAYCGIQLYLWGGKVASSSMMPELSLQIDDTSIPDWLYYDAERKNALVINQSVEALAVGELNLRKEVTKGLIKVMALRPIIDAFTETRHKLFSFPAYEYIRYAQTICSIVK